MAWKTGAGLTIGTVLLALPTLASAKCYPGACATGDDSGFSVVGDATIPYPGSSAPGSANAPGRDSFTETAWVPTCTGNAPGVADSLCTFAITSCPGNEIMYSGWARTITAGVAGPWGPTGTQACIAPGGSAPTPPSVDIAALVLREFQRLPVPEPSPGMQPAVKTLVNLDTVLFDNGPQQGSWDIVLVGRSVSIRAAPTQWRWDMGDGAVIEAGVPGRPYPAMDVTHAYRRSGTYDMTVTTTWSGDYSVNGGPWLPINGVVVRTSSTALTVVEASPQLIDPSH